MGILLGRCLRGRAERGTGMMEILVLEAPGKVGDGLALRGAQVRMRREKAVELAFEYPIGIVTKLT
jgi:hypothetical protein